MRIADLAGDRWRAHPRDLPLSDESSSLLLGNFRGCCRYARPAESPEDLHVFEGFYRDYRLYRPCADHVRGAGTGSPAPSLASLRRAHRADSEGFGEGLPKRSRGAEGRAEYSADIDRRRWLRSVEYLRRADSYANHGSPGQERFA